MSERVWGAIGHYMQAKFEADRDLVRENGRRGLEFTIVRPGGLRDEEGTGRIEAGKVHFGERMIAREVSWFFFLFSFLPVFFFSGRGPYVYGLLTNASNVQKKLGRRKSCSRNHEK